MCGHSNSHPHDRGTLNRGRTSAPSPFSARHKACVPIKIGALVFDADDVVRFLDSAGHAYAMERHTRLKWVDYNDSSVINAIYSLMPESYGRPGWVEPDTGDPAVVLAEANAESLKLQEHFTLAMSLGPQRVAHFMQTHEELRRDALAFVQDTFREVQSINSAVQAEAARGIARLSLIKAAATITFKAGALALGGWPAFFLGAGYDISLNVIKDFDHAGSAVTIGLWSKSWKKAVKDAAKGMANIYKEEAMDPEHKIAWLSKRLEQMEDKVFEEGSKQALKFAKDQRRLIRAQDAASAARNGARIMTGVKYGFFAYDVYKALSGANDEMREAGYSNGLTGAIDAFRH
jgi:hypothetical protein